MNQMRFLLIYVCLITGCVCNDPAKTNASRREELAKKVLGDKENTQAAFALAVDELNNDNVPASFWLTLANDTEYPKDVRSAFIVQLFRKYVHPGMTLNDLAAIVGPSKWIDTNNVVRMVNLSGTYPVRIASGDTAYVIRVLPDSGDVARAAICLVFGKNVERDDFLKSLEGLTSAANSLIVIKDIGVSPSVK